MNNNNEIEKIKDLAIKISNIHQNTNDKFGFKFDTPIGGLDSLVNSKSHG